MSQPTLDSIPLGTNTTNGTTSPIDSILVREKTPKPTPLTGPTKFLEQNGEAHIPGEPDTVQSSSDS